MVESLTLCLRGRSLGADLRPVCEGKTKTSGASWCQEASVGSQQVLGADAQKHPLLALILRHISVMVPYPEVTVRKRFSKCTKQNFPCVRSPSGDTVPRAVDQSAASLQTKISCCMSTKAIACGEA